MQVLKFGGSSVANANDINRVVEIIKNNKADTKIVVVVSVLSGVTNMLLKTAILAETNDELYKTILKDTEKKTFACCKRNDTGATTNCGIKPCKRNM